MSDGQNANHFRELWDVVPWLGLVLTLSAAAYFRGRFDESGLSGEAWAQQAAGADVYWAMLLFFIGMMGMGVWLAVTFAGVLYGRS